MTPREGWDVAEPWINTESVGCRVLAITKTTVMVAQLDKKKEVMIYPLHKRLANGGFNLFEMDPHCYRSEDAQVGDFLDLQEYKGDDKITYCLSFSIVMRPGGKVPPPPGTRKGIGTRLTSAEKRTGPFKITAYRFRHTWQLEGRSMNSLHSIRTSRGLIA